MSTANEPSEALVAQVADGDERAFATLFDRHGSEVLGLLVRLLASRVEAEEVLQESFLEAWRRAGSYRPQRASARGWLFMLARSRAVDRLRSRGARSEREQRWADTTARHQEPVGTSELEQRETERAVGAALGALPDEQRRCVELAFFEGLSQSQISSRLEVPLGTVKSRSLAGLRKLRALLEQKAEQPRPSEGSPSSRSASPRPAPPRSEGARG